MKHGWAFLDGVTHAIEGWSDAVAQTHPGAFHYRGADLRHAVERSLFFRLANDTALQRYFDGLREGVPVCLPPDPWSAALAPWLAGPCAPVIPAAVIHRRLRSLAGNLSRLGRQSWRTARLTGHPTTLLLAIHPKFVSFLLPVAEAIGPAAAFLSVGDAVVEHHLAARGLPGVALRAAFSLLPPGPVLRHFPDLCAWFDRMATMMESVKPATILVPEGNAPIYEIANQAGKSRGVATVCIQQGAPAYTNPGFRKWSFADVVVWGEAFVEPFARHNPDQHFTVTGTPAILPAPREQAPDAAIRSIGFFLQKEVLVIPTAEWRMLLDFIAWVARSYSQLTVIVRDHPSQPSLSAEECKRLGDYPNLRFMPPPQHPLNNVLGACDVAVAAASTTLLEAAQAGAIPFIFGTAYPKDFPDIAGMGAAILAPDGDAARSAFARLVEDPAGRAALRGGCARLRPALFAATGRDGARRIADAVARIGSRRP
jgi:hypothetical protein